MLKVHKNNYDSLERLKKCGYSRDVRDVSHFNQIIRPNLTPQHNKVIEIKRPTSYQGARSNNLQSEELDIKNNVNSRDIRHAHSNFKTINLFRFEQSRPYE